MLYKVTPMMDAPKPKARAPREPGQPRKRRKTSIYDAEGHEVLITMMCLKCKTLKPLMQFGLRKMADGAIRNQPWCRTCRSSAGTHKPRAVTESDAAPEPLSAPEVVEAAPAAVVAEVVAIAEALAEPLLTQAEGEAPPPALETVT